MQFLKHLLLPIQTIYYIIIIIRNTLYDLKILKTHVESIFIISVGNIKTGGTGKTPMVEYILNLFNEESIAVLSRGYKRKTRGFILANAKHSAKEIGDENHQLYNKFNNTLIACDNNRLNGVRKLIELNNSLKTIVLDDAFQHRKLHRDIDILLTEYDNLFIHDTLIPIGTLREYQSASERADFIIVTKCPINISPSEISNIKQKLRPTSKQKIYFSYIKNYSLKNMSSNMIIDLNKKENHILITGIENPQKIVQFLNNESILFHHIQFEDHHYFSKNDIKKTINYKKTLNLSENLLLTEKDFYRLTKDDLKLLKKYFNLITIQIEIDFVGEDGYHFNNQLLKFAKSKKELI